MEANRSLLGSRATVFTPIENVSLASPHPQKSGRGQVTHKQNNGSSNLISEGNSYIILCYVITIYARCARERGKRRRASVAENRAALDAKFPPDPFPILRVGSGYARLRECMEETHEYANEQGKQGGKNPRKIPNSL